MTDPELYFTDARTFTLHGKPFADSPRHYARLPGRAQSTVPEPVWGLSQMAAGLFIDIDTNATQIHVEVERDLTDVSEAARGNRDQAVDAYRWDGARWGWVGIQKDLTQAISRFPIAIGMPPGRNRLRLYLGYSVKVQRLAVGVPVGCDLRDGTRPEPRPILYYGTSIIHGYSASRAGMTLPAQLTRRLGRTVWNQGFAGNARMEPALADLYAGCDPAIFVIDCLPNMSPELVRERCATFVRMLRSARPRIPILLVENIVYQATYQLDDRRGGWGPKNDMLRAVYRELLSEGMTGLHYLPGDRLLGEDGDGATDGTHPNDLGYARMADALEPVLRGILAGCPD